jgi:starch-binding outer membrane protein, SusD/RagB family
MKRYFLLLILFAIAGASCNKFLDTKPTDFLSPEYYYDTEPNVLSALAGVYQPLGTANMYGDAMFFELGANTDECFRAASSSTTGVWVYNFDYTEPYVNGLWSQLYMGIERANLLIKNINLAPMDSTERKAILGEALFMRGYYYFMLAEYWGGVPLRTEPTPSPSDISVPRATMQEVYAQVLKDMTTAEPLMYTSTHFGYASRASRTVAEGMLARVCLTMAGYPLLDKTKYADALMWAQKVQASGEHTLLTQAVNPDADNKTGYSQVFVNMCQDKYDIRESMFEAEEKGNRTDGYTSDGRVGNDIGIGYSATNYADSGYCYGSVRIMAKLYNLYGAGDLRRDWAIGPFSYTSAGARSYYTATQIYNRNPGKWRRTYELLTPKDKNFTPTNYPLLRYSDVLLMLAEAENQVNGPTQVAYDALNQVRRRAYGKVSLITPDATADAPAGMSQTDFQLFIEDERARELCFEALRRPDLIRWGIFVQTMNDVGAQIKANGGTYSYGSLAGLNVSTRHLLFPIPSSEMSVNKAVTQNPGW